VIPTARATGDDEPRPDPPTWPPAASACAHAAPSPMRQLCRDLAEGRRALGWAGGVKPVMSSSGKGQSVVRGLRNHSRWEAALAGARRRRGAGDPSESFLRFEQEITLLTGSSGDGPTLFCPPIGPPPRSRGDYQCSWQPAEPWVPAPLATAEAMAPPRHRPPGVGPDCLALSFSSRPTRQEGGGFFGTLAAHTTTGLVTLRGQNLSGSTCNLRAVLGLPIPAIPLPRRGRQPGHLATGNLARRYEGVAAGPARA